MCEGPGATSASGAELPSPQHSEAVSGRRPHKIVRFPSVGKGTVSTVESEDENGDLPSGMHTPASVHFAASADPATVQDEVHGAGTAQGRTVHFPTAQ